MLNNSRHILGMIRETDEPIKKQKIYIHLDLSALRIPIDREEE